MSSQTAATRSKDVVSSTVPIHKEDVHSNRVNEAVSRRAYELYEQSGREHGNGDAHWYQAESELLRQIPEIRESASWYTVNCSLPGFSAEQVHVGMDETRAVIMAQKSGSGDEQPDGAKSDSSHTVYFVANWPEHVDPATASAYLKNDSLTLTVKRAGVAA